jgi:diaminohydroxyphosphoribosylaminopyrimidine deaminase/5-amino-6-(5-phosphoribosylamino)uracil reductase
MHASERHALDETGAWTLLLALARRASQGRPIRDGVGVRLGDEGVVEDDHAPFIVARPSTERGWSWPQGATGSPALELLFDLYMPLCAGPGADALTLGHLAQSLDGRIALGSGKSQFISGQEDLLHVHRLRALSDVVLVGRRTVHEDDPQLTTRLCAGPSPVRAVVDPGRRLGTEHRIFQSGPSTLLFCAPDAARAGSHHGRAEVIAIPPADGELPVVAILAELRRRGLRRIYVEGGGLTVSRFLAARALTRLQLTVAPKLLGSGRPALTLPEIEDLSEAHALDWRCFPLGPDVLFDCTVRR